MRDATNQKDVQFKKLDREKVEETLSISDEPIESVKADTDTQMGADASAKGASESEESWKEAPTVGLRANIDVSDATDEQVRMYQQMATIFEQQFTLFVQKNLGYGSSFLSAGEAEMALDGGDGPFDSSLEANLYGVWKRTQDKTQRLYEQAFCNGNDPVGEDLAETSGDAMNYWAMIKFLSLHGEQKLEEGQLVADGGHANEYADDARQKGYFEEEDDDENKADDDALGGVVD